MTTREIYERGAKKRSLVFQTPFHDDQVLTFAEWCALNAISPRTGRRIWKSDNAPEMVKLTAKRRGVTMRANREWQARGGHDPHQAPRRSRRFRRVFGPTGRLHTNKGTEQWVKQKERSGPQWHARGLPVES